MTRVGGNAAVAWTESGGKGTERVFRLPAPLRDQVPSHAGAVVAVDSLDMTVRDVFTYGSGAYELTTVVRFADDPQGLLDLVRAGAENTTLTLYPDVTDSGVSYTVNLVAPVNAKQIERDAQTQVWGDMQVTLRFRRTNQGVFAAAWNKDELFRFVAGGRMDEATFTRASSASYVDKGLGTVKMASTNTARVGWVRVSAGDYERSEPGVTLESSATNLLKESSDFAQWTANNSVTLTSGQAGPSTGSEGWLVADGASSAISFLSLNTTAAASTRGVVSGWIKKTTATNTSTAGHAIELQESTNTANDKIKAFITWSSGIPSFTYSAGTTATTAERYRNGWWRVAFKSTGNLVAARVYQVTIVPSAVTASATGTLLAAKFQLEQ